MQRQIHRELCWAYGGRRLNRGFGLHSGISLRGSGQKHLVRYPAELLFQEHDVPAVLQQDLLDAQTNQPQQRERRRPRHSEVVRGQSSLRHNKSNGNDCPSHPLSNPKKRTVKANHLHNELHLRGVVHPMPQSPQLRNLPRRRHPLTVANQQQIPPVRFLPAVSPRL